jgi:tRNA(Leu) C34 or U34 (ribose-2'-O)-methylase TrmL
VRGFAAIGLYSPKNGLNIGGAMRAAHCYGASLVVLEAPRFQRQASNVTEAQRHIPTIVGPLLQHRPYDCPLVVIEIVDGAIPLPDFIHPERALYAFGPEDGSVPARIVERAQHVVSVPTAYCMQRSRERAAA